MSKQFWGIVILVVILFAGFFALTGNKANAPSKTSSNSPTQHIEGQGKSGVTLVEYGDYECPYCGQAYPVIKQVQQDLSSQIFFQFRNFPLVQIHQNAFAGARAAEAAGLQGKFWQMHDALYESQSQWDSSNDPVSVFNQLAQQLGLNVNKFKADYQSGTVNNLINADIAQGNKLNVQATPTFLIDGKQTDLPYQQGAAAVEKVINQAIAQKTGKS